MATGNKPDITSAAYAMEKERVSRKSVSAGSVSIQCVGVDGLLHVCKPEHIFTGCGVAISRKTLGKTDHGRRSCYSCTY